MNIKDLLKVMVDQDASDIYITVDVKNTKGQWVHIGKSRVYKDHNLNQDLHIDLEVSLGASISKRTDFLPEEHGFHFNNLFVVEPDGEGFGVVHRREAVIGEILEDGIEVLEGLQNGDRIVTAGVSRIHDGMKVRFLETSGE